MTDPPALSRSTDAACPRGNALATQHLTPDSPGGGSLNDQPTSFLCQPGACGHLTIARLTLHDPARSKKLQLRVSYPAAEGMYPTIVFSHGASGSKDAYQPLISYWVTHGYVCIQPTHGDSLTLLTREERRRFATLFDYICSSHVRDQWRSRVEDVQFVLDCLPEIAARETSLQRRLDPSRIGMGGHSFGSQTAQLVAGMSLRLPDTPERFSQPDARPGAFMMLSPQGPGGTIDDDSWSQMVRPTFMATGSNDNSSKGRPHTWRMEAFARLPAREKYLLFIHDGHHDFGGISGSRYPWAGPHNPQHVECVRAATLAFWDAHLKDDAAARSYLQTDALAAASQGMARISFA